MGAMIIQLVGRGSLVGCRAGFGDWAEFVWGIEGGSVFVAGGRHYKTGGGLAVVALEHPGTRSFVSWHVWASKGVGVV